MSQSPLGPSETVAGVYLQNPYVLGELAWNLLFKERSRSLGTKVVCLPALRLNDEGFIEEGEQVRVEVEVFDHSWIGRLTNEEFEDACNRVIAMAS